VKLLSNLTPSEHPVGAGLDQAIAGLAAKLQAALGISQGASATETQDQEDRDSGNWKDPDPSDTEDSNKAETSDQQQQQAATWKKKQNWADPRKTTGYWKDWEKTGYLKSAEGKLPVSEPKAKAEKRGGYSHQSYSGPKQHFCSYCHCWGNHRSEKFWHKGKSHSTPELAHLPLQETDEESRPPPFNAFGGSSGSTEGSAQKQPASSAELQVPPTFKRFTFANEAQAAASKAVQTASRPHEKTTSREAYAYCRDSYKKA
jgi:hypothetical protein